jgi:hypothetical protein
MLTRPLRRTVAEPNHSNPAWQATFGGSPNQIGCKKGKRYQHVHVPNAALLARGNLFDTHAFPDDFRKPARQPPSNLPERRRKISGAPGARRFG